MAKHLGTPLLPWQRLTADVAGERVPDPDRCVSCRDGVAYAHTCPYRYQVVVVTVPRQSGKTTLMRAVALERCISNPGLSAFYTAQTGKDARDRWNDLVKQINRSAAFKGRVQVRRAAGQERLILPNESEFRCFAPTAQSLHGYTPPLVMLDEAFAHDEVQGHDLMGAIGPAQITLPHRQLWIVSTMGTAASGFLNSWVDAGRSGADRVALIDYGAGPEVSDPYDREAWWTFHPGLGHLAAEDDIAAQAAHLPRSEFERAYCNRPTVTESLEIPREVWAALGSGYGGNPVQEPPSDTAALVLAYDVAHDRSAATITAHWQTGTLRCARVVDYAPGVGWVADRLQEYRDRWRVRRIVADNGGPTREVTDELRRRHVPVDTTNAQEFATAWGFLMRHLADKTLLHDGSPVLATAAGAVVTRPMGDGQAPSRRNSPADVSALVALMVGDYFLSRTTEDDGPDYMFA